MDALTFIMVVAALFFITFGYLFGETAALCLLVVCVGMVVGVGVWDIFSDRGHR